MTACFCDLGGPCCDDAREREYARSGLSDAFLASVGSDGPEFRPAPVRFRTPTASLRGGGAVELIDEWGPYLDAIGDETYPGSILYWAVDRERRE